MHYLAFSLGHKLHSSILLIYFVCMKQIELLHAGRSQLTDISLPYDDAVTASVLHSKTQPKGNRRCRNIYKLPAGLWKAYRYFRLHSNHFHTAPHTDLYQGTTMFLLLPFVAPHCRLSHKRILDNRFIFFCLLSPGWLFPVKRLFVFINGSSLQISRTSKLSIHLFFMENI